jgi:YrbI family 3-deoxy-D-manno-octulosonate 8-phosphate phosphatase
VHNFSARALTLFARGRCLPFLIEYFMDQTLIDRIKQIKLLATDVDGVLTDAGMYYTSDGLELKKFNTRDGLGISLLRNAGFKLAIITSENTTIVANRAKKLKITDVYQGTLTKVEAMEDLLVKYSLTWNEIAYIGDDYNDLLLLSRVGLAVTPADGTKRNKAIAHYVTERKGGEGCVRELCDMILDVQEIESFLG